MTAPDAPGTGRLSEHEIDSRLDRYTGQLEQLRRDVARGRDIRDLSADLRLNAQLAAAGEILRYARAERQGAYWSRDMGNELLKHAGWRR